MAKGKICSYQFEDGKKCREPRSSKSPLCFFHDPKAKKNTSSARNKTILAIHKGKRLDGAFLSGIDLSWADLPKARLVKALLDKANLMRANFEKGHLFGASFKGADLFNTNFRGANLKQTDMERSRLLEIKIDGAKIAGINWGNNKIVINETEGKRFEKKKQMAKAREKYLEAEEIYRNIRTHQMERGLFDDAAEFFYREMVCRRKQLPLWSLRRFNSKIIDLLCGYGEKTYRVISCAIVFILFNSLIFYAFGIQYGSEIIRISGAQNFFLNIREYFLTVYFSVVTFTTLGYGDIAPYGISRLFATIEAFSGAFMMALFVLLFGRKMIR